MNSLKSRIKLPTKTIIGQLLPKLTDYQLEKFRKKQIHSIYNITETRFRVEDLNFNVKTYHYDENRRGDGIYDWYSNIIINRTDGKHFMEDLVITEDHYKTDLRYFDYKLMINNEDIVKIHFDESIFNSEYLEKDYYGKIGEKLEKYLKYIDRI
jgi:hypothetical protein